MPHYAHSGTPGNRTDWQLLSDHLEGVAKLAQSFAAPFGLGGCAELAGQLHDLGKYTPDFDRVLNGEPLRVDHATAGGAKLMSAVPPRLRPVAEVLAYGILGHHAGLPDRISDSNACMERRLEREQAPLAREWHRHMPHDFDAISNELFGVMRQDQTKGAFDLSVAARMVFSSLVDADYRDTEAFYARFEGRQPDRVWPALQDILPELRGRYERHMSGFSRRSKLDHTRADILTHVRGKAALAPGLFTLCVPTGGGKTLASLGFALDHAAAHGKRRIIYVIPYTSIIDQTAKVFRDVLGEKIVLEHHSSVDDRAQNSEQRDKLRLAMENWEAPVVVTTNVQLFESLFAARPSRCRKLHNIAGSVIVLDEAQCLPRELLLPTLAMIDVLATHYGCTVVLCTATQPAFDSAELGLGGLPLAGRELAPDPAGLARELRRATIRTGAEMDDTALISALGDTPQGMVIVNSRRHALELYRGAEAAGLEGLVHLTTRQYPAHRRLIIADIRERLKTGRPCRLIATSLIEAGVDLDFPVGWRAEAGLDSVIQAAGRVNREGRQPAEASVLTVFRAPDHAPTREVARLAGAMRQTAARHEDLLSPEAIRDWFGEVYWQVGADKLGAEMAQLMKLTRSRTNFPFREMAERYRMIDTPMVSVIIPGEESAEDDIARLRVAEVSSGALARALQPYTVQIPEKARELLRVNGKGEFAAQELRGDRIRAGLQGLPHVHPVV
ncbi:CRISPR-associated endonuclease Cas3'' [Salipiger manganoxidans]|nr:CRISPR-associated endonuclease Cas3'' [Salipiger manganoxidans]